MEVLPTRFTVGDSAVVDDVRIHLAPDGSILGFKKGTTELRRVAPFDMSKAVDHFVKAFAPR